MEAGYDRGTTLDWCREIDAGPFATLSCGERVISYSQDMRVLLSAAAALTARVRIMPSLYVLPMHSAVRAAKEIATLDVLSGGRVRVGVGVGGREQDYRALGVPFDRRHQRLADAVSEMRRVWRGQPVFEGGEAVGPAPFQPGGPAIYSGAMGPKAIARAAHWADGLYGFTVNADPAPARAQFDLARGAWEQAHREEAPRLMTGFWFSLADDAAGKLERYVFEYLKVAGTEIAKAMAAAMVANNPDTILRAIDAIEELGCDDLFFVPATLELVELERLCKLLARRG